MLKIKNAKRLVRSKVDLRFCYLLRILFVVDGAYSGWLVPTWK